MVKHDTVDIDIKKTGYDIFLRSASKKKKKKGGHELTCWVSVLKTL